MKSPLYLALALGSVSVVGVSLAADTHSPALMAPQRPKGSVALFNGRDLTGWKVFLSDSTNPHTIWKAHAGVLSLTGKPNGYLQTEQSYSNYHLHVEWRWPGDAAPKSNSGVFVHLHGDDKIWPAGIECQLAAGNAGQLVATDVTIPGAPIINQKARAPKLAASSEKPFGEWNSYDIICRGATIDVTVNGVHQNHVEGVSADAGRIGLQMEGYPIEFRSVWMEKL